MRRWPRPVSFTIVVLLAVALTPVATLGQESAAAPEDTAPELAQMVAANSGEEICDWSGGTLDLSAGARCNLPQEPVTDPWFIETFGSEHMAYVVEAAGGPLALADLLPEGGPVIDRVSFIASIPTDGKAVRRLDRLQNGKDATVVKGRKTDWAEADEIGLVSLHLKEPVNARRLSREGFLVARLQAGLSIIDGGYFDRKQSLTRPDGRKSNGLVVFAGDRIDFLVPGGLADQFTTSLLFADAEGFASGQYVGGSGGPDALIPLADFSPSVQCAYVTADVDPASTSDGQTYDLGGMTLMFISPLIPEDLGAAQPTFTVTLAPSGSRIGQDIEDITIDVAPESDPVRRAISLRIDMAELGLTGETGYYFGELPYEISGMSASWTADESDTPLDVEQATALLEEAGWLDTDGDGTYEIALDDAGEEIGRLAGGNFTATPIDWGQPGCGRDAHWYSLQDACRQPGDLALRENIARIFEEEANTLFFEPGNAFDIGFTRCSVFNQSDEFLATWLLDERFGPEFGYDPGVLAPFSELQDPFGNLTCEIVEDRVSANGLERVGSCADPQLEIFHDSSSGFSSYFAFAGADLDVDELATSITPGITDPDLDGDGISDRLDPDVDGDGIDNTSDPDNDDDLVGDDRDYHPTDPFSYGSPNAFGGLIESVEALAN